MAHGYHIIGLTTILILFAAVSLHAQWVEDGVALSPDPYRQYNVQITGDGAGGAIVTWDSYRNKTYKDLFAQRIDADGYPRWDTHGVCISDASRSQALPALIPDGSGGAIVTWMDYQSGNGDIYVQRIDADGNFLWPLNGYAICAAGDDQLFPQLTSDGSGGAIVVWQDERSGVDTYAQRIDADGNPLWTANGIPVCNYAGGQMDPCIAGGGSGGAVIAWRDTRSSSMEWDIYAQKIDTDGNLQWATDGVVICTADWLQLEPRIIEDGAGGAIITWTDARGTSYDVYAQRADAAGNVQWTANGVRIGGGGGNQAEGEIIPDGAGGAILAWGDARSDAGDVYAQRVDASGVAQWTYNGIPICNAPGEQFWPQIAPDGSGGAFVTWWDARTGSNIDVYAQNFDANGMMRWAANGVTICTASNTAIRMIPPRIAGGGSGGAVIAWLDERTGHENVYAMKVTTGGPVAAHLRSFSSSVVKDGIRLDWVLSEATPDIEFAALRAEGGSENFFEIDDAGISRDGTSFTFVDGGADPGRTYGYRVDYIDNDGRRTLFETELITIPTAGLVLHQNHPNPFNPTTTIEFYLPRKETVRLEIYDIQGRMAVLLIDGERDRGAHAIEWNGKNGHGDSVGSGVYFYRLVADKETITRKMLLVR